MDACLAVEREIEKVLGKFNEIDRNATATLQELLNHVQSIKQDLNEVGAGELSTAQTLILSQCLRQVRDTLTKLSSDHKDLHGSVSKVGKAIDRNFVSDFSAVITDGAFESESRAVQINNVICEHFLRQGMLDIAESLIEDSGLEIENEQKEPFLELHRILEALKEKELGPALQWARINRDRLLSQGSSLEFKLQRLQFIHLVSQGAERQAEALVYARNFAPFAATHAKELQVLMGSLLFMRQGIERSPYTHLLDPVNWADICDVFTRDACSLLGLSVESPLSVVIRAGCLALPPLLSIKEVMQQRQCSGIWSAKDELPVEIDLGQECRYHSIFACPILRQQSSDSNPPVRLICGHVISKDALNKLANGNKNLPSSRVKCPYCPIEQSSSEARQIFF